MSILCTHSLWFVGLYMMLFLMKSMNYIPIPLHLVVEKCFYF